MENYSGHWVGEMRGTSLGSFEIEFEQDGQLLQGKARVHEPRFGKYEYSIRGLVGAELSLQLSPTANHSGQNIGPIEVIAQSHGPNQLKGHWKSIEGRQGDFTAQRGAGARSLNAPSSSSGSTRKSGPVEKVSSNRQANKLGAVFGLTDRPNPLMPARSEEQFRAIKRELLTATSSDAFRIVGLCGPPGSGKSEMVNALAHDDEVRRTFDDGVFYMSTTRQGSLEEQLRHYLTEAFPEAQKLSVEEYPLLLSQRRTLLIFDEPELNSESNFFRINTLACHSRILVVKRETVGLEMLQAKLFSIAEPPVKGEGVISADLNLNFSNSAAHVIARARELAVKSKRAGITSSCLLFAFADIADSQNNTARFVRNALERSGGYKKSFNQFLGDSSDVAQQSNGDDGELLGRISSNMRRILQHAANISLRVSRVAGEIHQRHLLAALLVTPDAERRHVAQERLSALGIETSALRQEFREFIRFQYPEDDANEWNTILSRTESTASETKPALNDYVSGPAGYSSEFCGVGGTGPVFDYLDVEGLASRLAELVALRETKLPLAVGLFGNWGSGKSHFMNLMDRHMRALTSEEKRRPINEPGPWCREIVPIYFNAWHYLDTNLWASLVSEIFDALFRHVAGDAESIEIRREKVKKLIAELQKANGAAASAEESIELAKAAKANAIAEEQKAEAAAQRASRRRDRLEGWMDGVLDNLGTLLPEQEMKEGWREAVRVLHLEDARKSYRVLLAQVTEFQTLHGRARAIGRAILAPEGRTRRLAWLAGAVLGAPLAIGLASWGLTFWSIEIRRIGMVMGEITGLLAGLLAWSGAQLQRGRKLLEHLEELEKASRKKRAKKAEDPMLKRARARVAECVEKEEEARAQLKDAKAKVRRLEEELQELRPERRLFRFIEKRARAQDYREHLGLVSLVRRDFHELSRLFAETDDEFGIGGVSSGQEKREREELSASIDRIVLFVDDLDRCQPERVVDVLQAVHLLLAYPLFAVVVGVDQRCLKQSIEKQFQGLVSQGNPDQEREHPATSLDYLEKVFHIPFHLPPMKEKGFGKLIERLTDGRAEKLEDTAQARGARRIHTEVQGDFGQHSTLEAQNQGATASSKTDVSASASAHIQSTAIGSVPLHPWERVALKDYHSLIRTPRGATRLLNTYRLVRAGIPAGEWDAFCGDGKSRGEFRIAMLLLAAAAGYPAFARVWFQKLKSADSNLIFLSDVTPELAGIGWPEFKRVYDATFAQTSTKPNQEMFSKWLDRVERFAF